MDAEQISDIAYKCLRSVRGCATDEQWRQAHDAIVQALFDAHYGPILEPSDKPVGGIDF